jgi:hypothetical protein
MEKVTVEELLYHISQQYPKVYVEMKAWVDHENKEREKFNETHYRK